MQLFAVGLNHTTAPLALREQVAFAGDTLKQALAELMRQRPAEEAAIISTCNRTEIYGAGGEPGGALEWLAGHHQLALTDLRPHLYTLPQAEAVRHAFRVASGLDSMVVGEPQILGQMKDAVRAAEETGALGTTLHRLFQRSFQVAKEVRTNTRVGANVVSMAAAAVRLAGRIFPSLADRKVLFIGAGEMIELCATHFAAQHPRAIAVANRTYERGSALARRFGGEALLLRDLQTALPQYDVVVSCTAATLPIVGKGLMERVVRERRHEPMVMVDLAVPRDIEPEVGRLDDVFLYTIDDLAEIVRGGVEERRAAVSQAESIIEVQVGQFLHWMETRAALPVIRGLREQGDAVRRAELERARRLLAQGRDPAEVLEALSHGLMNKLLHGPTQALNDARGEEAMQLQAQIERIYSLRREQP